MRFKCEPALVMAAPWRGAACRSVAESPSPSDRHCHLRRRRGLSGTPGMKNARGCSKSEWGNSMRGHSNARLGLFHMWTDPCRESCFPPSNLDLVSRGSSPRAAVQP